MRASSHRKCRPNRNICQHIPPACCGFLTTDKRPSDPNTPDPPQDHLHLPSSSLPLFAPLIRETPPRRYRITARSDRLVTSRGRGRVHLSVSFTPDENDIHRSWRRRKHLGVYNTVLIRPWNTFQHPHNTLNYIPEHPFYVPNLLQHH